MCDVHEDVHEERVDRERLYSGSQLHLHISHWLPDALMAISSAAQT